MSQPKPEPPDWRTDEKRGFEMRKRFLALVSKECANWSQKAYDQYCKLLNGRKFDTTKQEMADGLANRGRHLPLG